MLLLLLRTRIQYYRNYLRHHFDRAVRIEIAVIILITFYLTGRSPTDIGYSLAFLQEPSFPARYASAWISLLPFFYLSAEAFALLTLRSTGEWQMLGALPIPKQVMANYHLLRHFGKTFFLLLLGTLPFFAGETDTLAQTLRFLTALGVLLTLQTIAFRQAYVLRSSQSRFFRRMIHWLPVETLIIAALFAAAIVLQNVFLCQEIFYALAGAPLAWGLFAALLFYVYRSYEPSRAEIRAKSKMVVTIPFVQWMGLTVGMAGALILRDVQLLWRRQRSIFFLLLIAVVIVAIPSLVQTTAQEVYVSSTVLQIIFSWLLINSLSALFEQDVQNLGLIKSLPIDAGRLWWSRWRLAVLLLAIPMLIPTCLMPFRYPLNFGFLVFISVVLFLVPAVFATLYCNAGFGMFPQVKYSSLLLNLSLVLMLLFWFFMPFGTPLLLAVMLLWIRKSQKHFQFLEVG